jgi:upstream activation factor subunit UAF30
MSKAIKKVSAAKAPAKKSAAAPAKTAKKAAVKTAAKKAPAKKTASAGLKALVQPSAKLVEIVGNKPMPRTEVTKKVWDYIKANGLQDKNNKRMINADAKLKPIFGKDQVSMFEMTALISKQLTPA